MADYSRFLFDALSGAGDAFVQNRERADQKQRWSDQLGLQRDEFDWRKGTDERDFGYRQTRDAADDSYRNSRAGAADRQWEADHVLRQNADQRAAEQARYDRFNTWENLGNGTMWNPRTGQFVRDEQRRPNAPSGYRWRADGQALEPIPGGPGERVPGELAARIGLAQDALEQLPDVREAAAAGGLTGPVDYMMGRVGLGAPGRNRRELSAGAEALTRMLTGAGMPASDAQREAAMYLPRVTDDAETIANKVDQLQRRLSTISGVAMRGRGGAAADNDDPLGIR